MYCTFLTTLGPLWKGKSNTMMTIRQVLRLTQREQMGWGDHDRDDHWPWWQWPSLIWWQWSRWPWIHLLLTFLFCLRTLICRGSKDHAKNIITFIILICKQYLQTIEMTRFPVQAQTIVTINKTSSSWVLWGSLVCEEWDDAEKAARALVSPQSKHTSTPFNRSVKMSNYK